MSQPTAPSSRSSMSIRMPRCYRARGSPNPFYIPYEAPLCAFTAFLSLFDLRGSQCGPGKRKSREPRAKRPLPPPGRAIAHSDRGARRERLRNPDHGAARALRPPERAPLDDGAVLQRSRAAADRVEHAVDRKRLECVPRDERTWPLPPLVGPGVERRTGGQTLDVRAYGRVRASQGCARGFWKEQRTGAPAAPALQGPDFPATRIGKPVPDADNRRPTTRLRRFKRDSGKR
jgi:hypothetical protein